MTGPTDQTIGVPTIVSNFTCYAFFRVGRDFETAAIAAEAAISGFSLVPYFLHCQAIELGLKAFLSLKGAKRSELKGNRKAGHNLVALLERAELAGLSSHVSFSASDKAELRKANEYYLGSGDDTKQLQYMSVHSAARAFPDKPDLEILRDIAAGLLSDPALERMYLEA